MTPVQIGINLPSMADDGTGRVTDLGAVARHAEQLGFDSVWVPDLVIGDGTPATDSMIAMAGVAPVTERVRLGFGVLNVPLRPVPWLALQIATLQHLSDQRVLLGIGVGGFPDAPFWQALGVASHDRGRLTDAALQVLPQLVTGAPASLGVASQPVSLTLGPPAAMPPILVGGTSPAAMRRAVVHGDGWFPSLLSADELGAAVRRLGDLAEEHGRACPSVTVGVHYLPDQEARAAFARSLVDDHGRSPDEAVEIAVTGSPEQAAESIRAYVDAGADHIVLAPTGPDWSRQSDTLAHARARLVRS